MTDDTKPTRPNSLAALLPAFGLVAPLSLFAGFIMAVCGGIFNSWVTLAAGAVLLTFGGWSVHRLMHHAATAGMSDSVKRVTDALQFMRSQGN